MSWRENFIGRGYYSILERWILPWMKKREFTPNRVTISGMIFAVMVPIGFFAHPFWGFLLLGLAGIADSADGLLARETGLKSSFGGFLDSSLDRVSDTFFIMGFWVLFWLDGRWLLEATIMVLLALMFINLISYVKARAEAAGISCEVGLMGRTSRVVYMLVWAFLLILFPWSMDGLLWIGMTLFILGCAFTVGQRIMHVRGQMADI